MSRERPPERVDVACVAVPPRCTAVAHTLAMRRRRSKRGGECLFRTFVCGAVSLSVTQLVILGAASLRGEFTVHTLLHGARRDDGTTALARQAPVPPPPPPHEVPITDGGILKTIVRQGDVATSFYVILDGTVHVTRSDPTTPRYLLSRRSE